MEITKTSLPKHSLSKPSYMTNNLISFLLAMINFKLKCFNC